MAKRRRFKAEFKAQIALEAIQGQKTINELASKYEIHPNQITQWKRQLLESAKDIFSTGKTRKMRTEEAEKNNLYQEIGKLKVELDFLKKKSGYNR